MTPAEIKEIPEDKLKDKLNELKKELFNLRFQKEAGQLENTAMLSNIKKDIARIYTIAKQNNITIR